MENLPSTFETRPKSTPSGHASFRAAEAIIRTLRAAGHEAYLVGGCVRDMLMGLIPEDYDIATSARPEQIMALFPHTRAVGAQFGVVLVTEEEYSYEVATFRADGVSLDGRHPASVTFSTKEEDVQRRDFTINGMLYDPVEKRVIDLVGGERDIQARVIRTIGNPHERFREDRLRLLRAIRFAARFDYAIEEATFDAICDMAQELPTAVSAERIGDEVMKMLTGPHAGRAVRLLQQTGLLSLILPEVEAMVGVDQPIRFHPEGDVFSHTCIMLDLLHNPSPALALGVLLHDVGKPATMERAERIRFDEHADVGAQMVPTICQRLRLPGSLVEEVKSLVENHMRFMNVKEMRLSTLKRLLSLPNFAEHLELHRLDCLASHGKLDNYEFCLRKMRELSEKELRPPRLLTGDDLIALGYKPGPLFRQILAAVEEAQLEGNIRTSEEAVRFVLARFPKGNCG